MTLDKHRKKKIRALALKMGTSYSTARAAFLEETAPIPDRLSEAAAELGYPATTLAPAQLVEDGPLTAFQGSAEAPLPEPFALGPNCHQLLNAEPSPDAQPTIDRRRLQVSLLWGDTVIDVRDFPAGHTVTVGPHAGADFRVYDDAIPETFALVAKDRLRAPAGARLALFRGQGGDALPAGAAPLALDERALISLATTHLVVRWVRPEGRVAGGAFGSGDLYFSKVLSLAFVAHLVLLVGFWLTPRDQESLSEDLFRNTSPLVAKVLLPPPTPHDRWNIHRTRGAPSAPKPVGKHGPPTARLLHTAPPKPGGRTVKENHSLIMSTGLIPEAGALAKLLGGSGPSDGINKALGDLTGGAKLGDSRGFNGFGSHGGGPGGGGGLIDIGSGFGGRGEGPGTGVRGQLSIGGRGKVEAPVRVGKTTVVGSLSREVIASIVRKHQNEIRDCYESQLNHNPGLNGKVAVAFTISGTGEVAEANVSESTMGDSWVESCMTTKVRRWTFPEPQGGGQVFVTYPWVFKPTSVDE